MSSNCARGPWLSAATLTLGSSICFVSIPKPDALTGCTEFSVCSSAYTTYSNDHTKIGRLGQPFKRFHRRALHPRGGVARRHSYYKKQPHHRFVTGVTARFIFRSSDGYLSRQPAQRNGSTH